MDFRPLAEGDLELLCGWLAEPHVRRFYQPDSITLEEVRAKYRPRILGEEAVRCVLACQDGEPFGFLQAYRNADYPDWAEVIDSYEGQSVDLFVGPAERLKQGLGARMLAAFTDQDGPYFICHGAANGAAMACSLRAGFRELRWLYPEDEPCLLLTRDGPGG